MKLKKKTKTDKKTKTGTLLENGVHFNKVALLVIAIIFVAVGGRVLFGIFAATGNASLSLSPAGGSFTVGSTITVTIYETDTIDSPSPNSVTANLSYPTSLLQYNSITTGSAIAGSPFSITAQSTGGSGVVNIAEGASTPVSGQQTVAQVSFTVLAPGTATIAFTSGSDVWNGNGNEILAGGTLPSYSYTLASPNPTVVDAALTTNKYVNGVSYAVTPTVTANNGGTISSVTIKVDGTLVGTDTTSPYNFTIAPPSYTDATHVVLVTATDNQGHVGTFSDTIYVDNGDVNGDGCVGGADLSVLANNWNTLGGTYAQGNMIGADSSTPIGGADLSVLANNWHKAAPGVGTCL